MDIDKIEKAFVALSESYEAQLRDITSSFIRDAELATIEMQRSLVDILNPKVEDKDET